MATRSSFRVVCSNSGTRSNLAVTGRAGEDRRVGSAGRVSDGSRERGGEGSQARATWRPGADHSQHRSMHAMSEKLFRSWTALWLKVLLRVANWQSKRSGPLVLFLMMGPGKNEKTHRSIVCILFHYSPVLHWITRHCEHSTFLRFVVRTFPVNNQSDISCSSSTMTVSTILMRSAFPCCVCEAWYVRQSHN